MPKCCHAATGGKVRSMLVHHARGEWAFWDQAPNALMNGRNREICCVAAELAPHTQANAAPAIAARAKGGCVRSTVDNRCPRECPVWFMSCAAFRAEIDKSESKSCLSISIGAIDRDVAQRGRGPAVRTGRNSGVNATLPVPRFEISPNARGRSVASAGRRRRRRARQNPRSGR